MPDLTAGELGHADLEDLSRLVAQAGWNQVDADWQMMMWESQTFGFRKGSQVVASALAMPYGPDFGWISMVLVDKSYRRQGLATQLMQGCTAFLESRGLTQVLDATSDGLKVYETLGFRAGETYQRWARLGRDQDVVDAAPIDLPASFLLRDRQVTALNRAGILTNLAERGAPYYITEGGADFGLTRIGNHAVQIGPIVARENMAARNIFGKLDTAIGTAALIDIPDSQIEFANHVRDHGFAPVRSFTRMMRGAATYPLATDTYAFAGPELG